MADDESRQIQTRIVFTGLDEAGKQIATLKQQLKEVQDARDRAFQSGDNQAPYQGAILSLDELSKKEESIYRQLQESNAGLTKSIDTRTASEIKAAEAMEKRAQSEEAALQRHLQSMNMAREKEIAEESARAQRTSSWQSDTIAKTQKMQEDAAKKISDLRAAQSRAANAQEFKDAEDQQRRMSQLLQSQWQQRVTGENKTGVLGNYANVPEISEWAKLPSYQQQLKEMNTQAETLYKTWKQTGDIGDKFKFDKAVTDFRSLNKEMLDFNERMGIANTHLDIFGQFWAKAKSHASWIVAGTGIAALTALPYQLEEVTKETDKWTQKLKQNMELAEQYHGNTKLLSDDIKQLQNVASIYALGYGSKVTDILESFSILSRRFKDTGTLTYLENLVQIIAKLDNVPVKETSEKLEAVILQFGLDAQQAKDFVNQFSMAVHSGRITGQELLDALQRSGSTFKSFNMGTQDAIALITTLTTTTARSGSTIGLVFRGMLTQIEGGTKKVKDAFQQLGIEIYNTNESGMSTLKDGQTILGDILDKYKTLDDKGKNILAEAISGGKYRVNEVKSLLDEGSQVYAEMKEAVSQASDEKTAELLKTAMESYATNITRVTAALQTLGLHVGNDLMPALIQMANGLTAGVMWLDDNRGAVEKLCSALVQLGEVLIAERILVAMFGGMLESATAKAILMNGGLTAIISSKGEFKAAMEVMGASAWSACMTMAKGITIAMARLGAIYGLIMAVQYAYDNFIADNGARGKAKMAWIEVEGLQKQIDNLDNGVNTQYMTQDQIDTARASLVDQLETKKSEAHDKQTTVDDLSNGGDYMKKAQEQADLAMKQAQEAGALAAKQAAESVPTSTIDDSGTGKKGRQEPTDQTASIEQKEFSLQTKELAAQAKQIKDHAAALLAAVDAQEKLYGVTESSMKRRDKILNDEQYSLGVVLQSTKEAWASAVSRANGLADGSTLVSDGMSNDGSAENTAFNYFVNSGFSKELAAGIVGNLMTESNLDPTVWAGDGSGSYGIGQWKDGRLQGLNDFAKSNGSDASDLMTQLAYVVYELQNNESSAMNSINNSDTSTPENSAYAVAKYYERPANPANPERQGNARGVYDSYANGFDMSTPVPSNLQDYISTTNWKGLDNQGKLDFVQQHKEELKGVQVTMQYLQDAITLEKQASDLQKTYLQLKAKRAEEWVSESEKIVEHLNKLAEYKAIDETYQRGVGITGVDKAIIEAEKSNVNVSARQGEMKSLESKGFSKDSEPYQKANSAYESAVMTDREKQSAVIEAQYTQSKSNVDYEKNMSEATAPQYQGIQYSRDKITEEIKEAQELFDAAKKKYDDLLTANKGVINDSVKAAQIGMAQALQSLNKLQRSYSDGLKQSEYSLADDLLIKGNSLRDVLKKLWEQLAEDALKALFKINSSGGGLFSQLLGLGRSNSSGYYAPSGLSVDGAWSGASGSFGLANGGETDGPTLAGEDGREVVVPVEKNTGNSLNLLSYAAKKLGVSTSVSASVSDKTMAAASTAAQTSSANLDHLIKLDTQITLMQQQNQMLLHLINNGGGGNSGVSVAQPIVMQQSTSLAEFGDMMDKAKRMRYTK